MKGLKGDDAAREAVKQDVQRSMQRGGAIGAGIGEATYQAPTFQEDPGQVEMAQ
jgi:hypothetical protein